MVRCDGNFIDNEMVVLGEERSVSRHQAGIHSKEVIDLHVHKYFVCFCTLRRKPTALKPFSTKYDIGKAMKLILAQY